MKTGILVLAFLFSCVFILSGCATISNSKSESASLTSSVLEPQATLKFSDVPVPVGLKFLPQESYSFESTGVRVGVLKYRGRADVEQTVSFYKEQMAIYNWDLLNIVEYGQRLLNFERENESCIVSLIPKGSSITVTVSLGPKAQILPKKSAEKPIK